MTRFCRGTPGNCTTSTLGFIGRPQMWERVQVGFGSTGKKRKGPFTKQCAWRKHGSCDTHLAEACPPKLWNTKIQSRKDAPKMAIFEAPCAQNAPGRSTMRLPEALLPRNPTWESSHFWGLTSSAGASNEEALARSTSTSFSKRFIKSCRVGSAKMRPVWHAIALELRQRQPATEQKKKTQIQKIGRQIVRTSSTTTRDRNPQFRGAFSTAGSPLDFLLFLQYLCAI